MWFPPFRWRPSHCLQDNLPRRLSNTGGYPISPWPRLAFVLQPALTKKQGHIVKRAAFPEAVTQGSSFKNF